MSQPVFLLIDGHSLAFRSYYAFAKSRDGGLKTSTGIPTSVCFGFFKSLLEVMATYHAQYMAIAFDLGVPTFRHEADINYKADRAPAPADLLVELDNLQDLLMALNLTICTAPGYEADDVIGTLSKQAGRGGYQVKILSGDRDLFQLVDDQISVLYLTPGKGSTPIEFNATAVYEKLGVTPAQVVDYKALCGDKSDNIPGVKGIGEKTAVKLINEYGTLEALYQNIGQIKGSNQQKLIDGKADAKHSQFMARIMQNVPLEIDLANCKLAGVNQALLAVTFQKLEFTTYLNQLDEIHQKFGGLITENPENTDAEVEDTWFFSASDTAANKPSNNLPFQVQIINNIEKLTQLVTTLTSCLNPNQPVAWDTETTALNPYDAKLVGIGCCWGENPQDVAYIPLGHHRGKQLDITTVLTHLQPILEGDQYPKVLQNAKFDRLIFRGHQIRLAGVVFDPMIASYLIDPEGSHGLKDLAKKYLNFNAPTYSELVPKGYSIADINIADVANYCGYDVYNTFHLVPILQQELIKTPKLHQILQEVELPLEPVLAEMEYVGIRVDKNYLYTLAKEIDQKLGIIAKKAYQEADEMFNLDSPKQLSHILFNKLQLDAKKSRKIKTGYSTDAGVLEKLQGDHPLVDTILEHRTLAKLKSTYIDALPLLVRDDTGRVHTHFNQTVTSTGRLSSSDPNLQNIPIKTEFSRLIRKAFLPEANWLLVSADYSQIELRILAHLSEEPVLIHAYQNNLDVHTVTARLLFEKETISSEERRLGKTINFGVIYGMGAQKFARTVGVTIPEAKKFIDKFYHSYPQVFAYLEKVKIQALSQGYVETILGRRRYFHFDSEKLRQFQGDPHAKIDLKALKMGQNDAQFLRSAANAPIQGSSADIIKKAMVKLAAILPNYQARMLLQVHDELVLEVARDDWEELQPQIVATMQNAVLLNVPLVVDIRPGENWMEAK